MGVSRLVKASLVLPRIETQSAVSKLAELEWFHSSENNSEFSNSYYDDLVLRAQRLFQEIDEVIRSLGIPLEIGVMTTMFKGAPKEKTDYTVDGLETFIGELEDRKNLLLEEPNSMLKQHAKLSKELEEYENIGSTLEMAAELDIDISLFKKLRFFSADIFVISSTDESEILKSLGDIFVYTRKLDENKSALLVFGSADDSERITKILRSFGVHPLNIPSNMPQNPSTAYKEARARTKELEAKLAKVSKEMEKIRKSILAKALSLHEASKAAKEALETTRKPPGTKHFAIIQGFIPESYMNKFRNLTKDYMSVFDQTGGNDNDYTESAEEKLPSLLSNKRYINTFEVITETQGLPRYDEVDPTPIIAFVWPLFYGIMFADLGHGLLLFGLGMLLRQKGNGSIRTWGTLLAASGAAASIAGLGTGELFGFHFEQLAILKPMAEALPFVGMLSVSELTFAEVTKILEVSIAIGIVHILLAFFLRLHADFKRRNKLLIWTKDIPTILQYLAVVAIILAAIGSGYDIIGMFGITGVTHDEPVPWLTFLFGDWVTVELVAKVAPLVIIGTVVVMIIGGMKEEEHARKHGRDEGGGMVGIVVEVIMVRIIEMLSNTISYSRLGIMLLVHSALLVTVNGSFEEGGGYAVLIGGNIGIMMIEGLIVYIQTIRLHLYEWFPKWYIGDGIDFKKIIPKMLYTNLIWKKDSVSKPSARDKEFEELKQVAR
jgi:V/A-type H+/Na+-transporting ATPase subunit I